jgi:RNA polymerase sigma-70 factor, ECF subfamily
VAFEKILYAYEKRIFSYLYRIVGQKEDAEDLTQTTFLKLYKNIKSINLDKNFNAWIYKIATNTAYDWLRKKRGHPEQLLEDISTIETIEDETAYDMIEGVESKEEVENAMNKIKKAYKSILLLFYHDELSYQEIADALSIPLNTVKSHLYRAKKALKDQLIPKI